MILIGIPAPEIEALVVNTLRDRVPALEEERQEPMSDNDAVRELVEKIVVKRGEVVLELKGKDNGALTLSWAPPPPARRREVVFPDGQLGVVAPIRSETRARLVEGIARARLWLEELVAGRVTDTKQIAKREGCSDRSVRMTMSLAFLNPEVVKGAVGGTLPHNLGTSRFVDDAINWGKQMKGAIE